MQMFNWLSYFAVGELAWMGGAGPIRELRKKHLGLKGWGKHHGPHALYYCKV